METIQNEPLNRCEEVLAHDGVKGMHWYIRRYQPYPSGYDGEGKFVGKRAARKAAKIEKRQARHQAKVKRNIEVAVNNGDQKTIEKLRDKIEPEEYNKLHDEAVANGIDQAIKERDLSQLRKYKKDIISREYKHQKDRIEFKKAVDNDNSKKIKKLLPKVDPEDVTEATDLIKSRVALQDQKLSKIRQDSELMAKMDKLASGLGKVSKVTSSVASISKSINDVNTTLTAFSKASDDARDKKEKKEIERIVKSGDLTKIEQYKERMDYNQLKEAYGKAYVMNTRAIDTAIAKGNLDDVYKMMPWMDASDMSKVITKIKNLEDRGAAFSDDISYEEVLTHHGTKGMHWGIRRYQNPDGSLTAAGRRRYLGADGKVSAKGAKRMAKDYKKSLTEVARDAADRTVVNKKMVKYSEKQLKKSRESYEKSIGTNKETRKSNELKARENLHEEILKRQKADMQTAKNLANELATKYGDKSVKSLYDKNGEFKSKDSQRIVSNTLKRFGAVALAGGIGIGIARLEKGTAGQAKDTYKRSYVDFYNFEKTRSDVNRIKQDNTTPSKKEQKSNLKELSSLSKTSGFDKAMKKLNSGDSEGFTKEIDRIKEKGIPKSNTINKIAQSKSVTNAQKEHDKAQSEWTKAQKELSDYVKKNGYPQSDKHSETTKDPTYNRLQEAADKAYDANSRAYDKLQKSIYSEMGKQIGKDPTADNLEAIRYMIELQIK